MWTVAGQLGTYLEDPWEHSDCFPSLHRCLLPILLCVTFACVEGGLSHQWGPASGSVSLSDTSSARIFKWALSRKGVGDLELNPAL